MLVCIPFSLKWYHKIYLYWVLLVTFKAGLLPAFLFLFSLFQLLSFLTSTTQVTALWAKINQLCFYWTGKSFWCYHECRVMRVAQICILKSNLRLPITINNWWVKAKGKINYNAFQTIRQFLNKLIINLLSSFMYCFQYVIGSRQFFFFFNNLIYSNISKMQPSSSLNWRHTCVIPSDILALAHKMLIRCNVQKR